MDTAKGAFLRAARAVEDHIVILEEALCKYGRHLPECEHMMIGGSCTCGFAEWVTVGRTPSGAIENE